MLLELREVFDRARRTLGSVNLLVVQASQDRPELFRPLTKLSRKNERSCLTMAYSRRSKRLGNARVEGAGLLAPVKQTGPRLHLSALLGETGGMSGLRGPAAKAKGP
jgi:hypothetical protein